MADDRLERFVAFGQRPSGQDGHSAEFEAALLVARAINVDLDVAAASDARATLLRDLAPDLKPWEALADFGFRGNEANYQGLDNSAIDQVLTRRTGIPISLGAVLLEVARDRGYAASGINHPGHFLVRIEDDLIDPFTMEPVVLDTADRARARALLAISPVEFALRMLNNLKYQFSREQLWDQALRMVDYQLALVPEHPQLLCEKGEFWNHLGASGAAADAYRRALAAANDAPPELTAKLQARLAKLAAVATEVVH